MNAIAIDGPASAGKSTIAKAVSQQFGYIYVDTGALYRAIGLFAVRKGLNPRDQEAVAPLLAQIDLQLRYVDGTQRVLLNGEDVSETIRSPEISMAASDVSAMPAVREFLLEQQRRIAAENNVIMDGRDIGTVVLPDADVKFFLTASVAARACRRYREYLAKGEEVHYNDILADIKKRDFNDANRAAAPLRQAEDAILLDTSDITLAESVALVIRIIKEHIAT